jgi:hypothetical protein
LREFLVCVAGAFGHLASSPFSSHRTQLTNGTLLHTFVENRWNLRDARILGMSRRMGWVGKVDGALLPVPQSTLGVVY